MRTILGLIIAAGLAAGARADESGKIVGDVVARPAKWRAGVVAHLEKVPGSFRPPAHPVTIDQKGMKFIPHVVALLKGGSVVFKNSDAVRHNVFTPDDDKYNLGTWGQGETKSHTFNEVGVVRQLCNVHPEMLAYVVVLDNPYFAVSGDDGKFEIANVPPGTYTLKTWSEKLPETSRTVTVTAGAATTVHIELGGK
jgi:plastocyanin